MFVDPAIQPAATQHAPRTARRSTADRVREALLALAGGHGTVLAHREQSWASVTFAGARHRVTLEFTGPEAVAGGETLIAELPEHEFSLPRQLVADATVTAVDHTLQPQPVLRIECELLLLEDA